MSTVEGPSPELRQGVMAAIHLVRTSIRWKRGKDTSHLRTPIEYGHLPVTVSLADYEQFILSIANNGSAAVYGYFWRQDVYVTVVASHEGRRWLVMFGLNGVMETAFPPDDPDEYLADERFRFLDVMQELMK
jgi:hypothetical protein